MRKLVNYVRVLIMGMITAEVLTACGIPAADKEERARAALENKYREEFVISEVYPEKFGDLYYEVQAYPSEEPAVRFKAAIDTEDEKISDNYVERRLCNNIAEKLSQNLDGLQGLYYVFVHAVGPQPLCEDPAISLEEYLALDPLNRFHIYIFEAVSEDAPEVMDESVRSAAQDKFRTMFSGVEVLSGQIFYYQVSEEKLEEIEIYFSDTDDINFEFNGLIRGIPSAEWEYQEGTLTASEG